MTVAVAPATKTGWIVGEEWWHIRPMTHAEAVRHEWGEACWTARILSEGEIAEREMRDMPRMGCY